jgi:hypothetical protein
MNFEKWWCQARNNRSSHSTAIWPSSNEFIVRKLSVTNVTFLIYFSILWLQIDVSSLDQQSSFHAARAAANALQSRCPGRFISLWWHRDWLSTNLAWSPNAYMHSSDHLYNILFLIVCSSRLCNAGYHVSIPRVMFIYSLRWYKGLLCMSSVVAKLFTCNSKRVNYLVYPNESCGSLL